MHYRITFAILISICFSKPFNVISQTQATSFSFHLNTESKTSAGVYTSDSTLIRTLWSGISFPEGDHLKKWDGLLDDGTPAPQDKYHIKVLSHNVKYDWEGVVGNTSLNKTGKNIHRSWDAALGIRINAGKAYYCTGYGEGYAGQFYFNLSEPQIKYQVSEFDGTNQNTDFLATDGTNTYWAGYDPYQTNQSFVYQTRVSDNAIVPFGQGVAATMTHGITYSGVADYLNQLNSNPSGIAVQVTGNYLFVSHKGLGYVSVINKTTGAMIRTLPFTAPTALAVDGNHLWVCSNVNQVKKYPVNADGSLGAPLISLAGLNYPLDLNIFNSSVAVVDGGTSQQIKTYSTVSGASAWILGQLGGNQSSPLVANDKFLFKKFNEFGSSSLEFGSIAFQDDGSFWVCDIGNFRMQHFSSDRKFLESISYIGRNYSVYVDKNNKKRLLVDYLEFELDYSAPVRNAWVLKYNWQESNLNNYNKVRDIQTLSNGRTYGIRNTQGGEEIVELVPETGIRGTGVFNTLPYGKMYADGSLKATTFDSPTNTQTWVSKPLIGFDSRNNPIYGSNAKIQSVMLSGKDPKHGSPFGSLSGEVTSSGLMVSYEGSLGADRDNFRLGGTKNGKFKFRTARTTPLDYSGDFPIDGRFDVGNFNRNPADNSPYAGYAGNLAMVSDSNIICGYHGEFWKQLQTNKYNHFHESGLFIGQFGEVRYSIKDARAGEAGNALTPNLVKVNGELYLLHGDEIVHGGVHKWHVIGLNSVQIQIAKPTLETVKAEAGIDLLEGLVRGQSLQNSLGWERSIAADYYLDNDRNFKAVIGTKSYDSFRSPDLYIKYRQGSGSATITRSLGSNAGLSEWKLQGKISFDGHYRNSPKGEGGGYMEVLDNNGLVISRLELKQNQNDFFKNDIVASGTALYSTPEADRLFFNNQAIEISVKAGLVAYKYGNVDPISTGLVNTNANWSSPTKVRFYFYTNGQNYDRAIDIFELRFINQSSNLFPPQVVKASQSISFSNTPTSVTGGAPVTLTATASSGLPVTFSVLSGPGIITGNVLTFNGYGTVAVQASQAGSNAYESATATLSIVRLVKTTQTIVFNNPVTTVSGGTPVTLTAAASSGLPITYRILSGPGNVSGNVLIFTGVGTVVVQASQAGNDSYEPATATLSITNTSKIAQTVTITSANKVYGGTPLTLTAVASSGLPVIFTIVSGSGTITNNILTFKGNSSVTVQASQSGNSIYASASATMKIDNSSKSTQSIKFSDIQNEVYGILPIELTPVASSGLPVSLEVISGEGYLSGNLLTFTDYGPVTIKATQPGNDQIEAATVTTVFVSKPQPEVKVYPNPIVDNSINVQFQNIPQGIYEVKLINLAGQTVYNTKLKHTGEISDYKISINQVVPPGICVLQITGNEVIFKQKMVKN